MTWPRGERLYHRLPEIHRSRDRQQGEPLRALLAIAESQLEALEDDIARLYENWFIETCEDWVVPYLGDLLGVRTLGEPPHAGSHPRTQVANALAYRQRKGTPAILERVARDVTGWPARVVEMFERLAHTQAMGHLRPGQGGLFDVRRGAAALAEAESPFAPPAVFRSVDVRRISSHRGRFNIPNLGLYLWRLEAFPLDDSPAAAVDGPPGTDGLAFTFDPLGRDVPLFNRLAPAGELVRQSAETDLPVPLLLPALDRDLQGYRHRFAALSQAAAAQREPASGFYGPGRAFEIVEGSGAGRRAVPPLEVAARNLDAWGAVGLLSGTFAAPPSVTAAAPAVAVTLAGDGPYTARLGRRPTSLGDAAVLLEAGLRAAHRGPRFAAARVIELGNRLLVLSGSPGDRVEIAATAGDTTTAGELLLTTAAIPGQGALSSVLAAFPTFPAGARELTVRFGTGAPLAVTLAAAPTDLASARRLLGQQLQASGARVLLLGGRLLVVGPDPAEPVRVSRDAAGADPAADLLGLAWTVAVDPERGRLLFAGTPAPPVRTDWAYGFAAEMGGGPYDRRSTLTDPATVLEEITVRKGSAVPSLPAALAAWVAAGRRDAVIRIADSDLYEEGFALTLPRGIRLAIEAADGERPVLRPSVRPTLAGSTGGGKPGTLVLNGLLVDGGLDLSGGLELRITHSTLVPRTGRASLGFAPAGPADDGSELSVHISSSIVGVLGLPPAVAALEIADSILDAAVTGDGGAQPLPVLVSGPLAGSIGLSSRLEMNVSFAGRAPVAVRLRKAPADLGEARAILQEALRKADPSASFTGAEVLRLGSFLLVRSGVPGETVTFAPSSFDARTIEKLALVEPPARDLTGLLSGDLSTFPSASRPQVQVTLGGDGPHTVGLAHWSDATGAATNLQTAIRAAGSSPVFQEAGVEVIDGRLLVRPGVSGQGVAITGLAAAPEAFVRLGLAPPVPPTPPEPLANTFVQGVFSGPLSPFPAFPFPKLAMTLDTSGPRTVLLAGATGTLDEVAQSLRAGLRSVGTGPFATAEVEILDERLLVRTATVPLPVLPSAGETADDRRTVRELAMLPDLGIFFPGLGLLGPLLFRRTEEAENVYGRLGNPVTGVPSFPKLQMQVTVGSTGPHLMTLGGIPRDLGTARDLLQAGLTAALSDHGVTAEVLVLGERLLVRAGGQTITFAGNATDPWTAEELGLSPGTTLTGLLSGAIASFPVFPLPAIDVSLSGGPPRRVQLASFPQSLEDLRAALETAITAAAVRREPTFTDVRVFRLSEPALSTGRLLIIPGILGDDVEVETATGDPLTAVDIKLTEPPAQRATALLSGELFPYPAVFQPSVTVTLGGSGTRIVPLGGLPGTLDRAIALLRTALRAAGTEPAWQGADVVRLGDRILVLSGVPGAAVTVAATPGDAMASKLDLLPPDARRLQGRLSGLQGPFLPLARARLNVQIGAGPFTLELVDLPVTLAEAAAELQEVIRLAPGGGAGFSGALVQVYGTRLLVLAGPGTDAVTVTAAAAPDDEAAGDLRLLASQAEAVLASGDLTAFAGLPRPEVRVKIGTPEADAVLGTLPANLAAARDSLEAAILAGFPSARVATTVDSRLLILSGNAADSPSFTATGTDPTTAGELKLTDAAGAVVSTALLSGPLNPFPTLTAPVEVDVTFGGSTGTADLGTPPTSLADARGKLEAALRAVDAGDPTFSGARVEVAGDQLVVIPGVAGDAPSFQIATGSTAATVLKLTTAAGAVQRRALVSGPLAPFPAPLSAVPAVSVAFGGGVASTRSFATVPATLAAARGELQTALQAAAPSGVTVTVEVVGSQRLLVRAGGTTVTVADATGRPATATALKLTAAAGGVRGLLSGDLAGFTGLTVMPRIGVEIGGVTATGRFARVPADQTAERDELQAAIRRAAGGTTFTNATVEAIDGRLLVTPGNPADTLHLTDVSPGPAMATRLSLTDALSQAVEVLLSGDGIALDTLSLNAALGTAGTRTLLFDEVPGDVGRLAVALQTALRAAGTQAPAASTFTAAAVFTRGNQILVLPGGLNDRVVFTAGGSPDLAALLELDAAHATVVDGLLSGDIPEPPDLRIAPSFFVSVAGQTSEHRAVLASPPTDMASAAALLQAAIRAAAPGQPTFANATVDAINDRLLVKAGNPADVLAFRDKTSGAAPVGALRLSAGIATPASGLESDDLVPFPVLTAAPRIVARFAGVTHTAVLTEIPLDLAGYRDALQAALRAAGSSPATSGEPSEPAFASATVRLFGNRLLVQPGTRAGLPVELSDVPPDPAATRPGLATALGLSTGLSLDGLLSGQLDDFRGLSTVQLHIDAFIGSVGQRTLVLPSPPSDIAGLRSLLEQALRAADPSLTFRGATVQVVGNRLLITPGVPSDLLYFAPAASRPDDVTRLRLDAASIIPAGGLLTGTVQAFPAPALKMSVRLGTEGPATKTLARFPVSLADAAGVLQTALRAGATAGTAFANAVVEVVAGRLRVAAPGVLGRDIRFAPVADDNATVFRLRLDDDNTEPADGLLSGDLSVFPKFDLRPLLRVTLGAEGPYQTELGFIPFTPEEARQSLEQAIRAAHGTPAFTLARVLRGDGDRLVVVPGRPSAVVIEPDPESPDTAEVLRLTADEGAYAANALLSGLLPPAVPLTAPAPAVRVALRAAGAPVSDFDVALTPGGGAFAAVAAALQAGIRGGAPGSPAATGALVLPFGPPAAPERLLAVPGVEGSSIGFAAAAADETTVAELRLAVGRAVGTAFTEEESGPALSLVRSTVFGRLVVRELPLASETLFTEPVRVARRHVGCVRYCYLPEGSETPRRFRCQPDLALAAALHQALETRARELGLASAADLPAAEREHLEARQRTRVLATLAPRFTSVRFGDPGYGQLRADNAQEILTGAEDGSEIGAMSRLHEPLRRRQLSLLLEDFMRFGLDAGLFFLT